MQNNTGILVAVVAVILVGVAGYFLGTSAGKSNQTGQQTHMMDDGSMMGGGIDQHFIVQMIPHHEGAIEMARVALEKSKRPEILALSQGIIDAQSREINDMTTWYKNWFGGTPKTNGMGAMGGMGHMDGMTGDLEELKAASAAQFDRVFIDQMIVHHEMALMMTNMLVGATERAEMKTLADQIITSQSREIDMMRTWRADWYGTGATSSGNN